MYLCIRYILKDCNNISHNITRTGVALMGFFERYWFLEANATKIKFYKWSKVALSTRILLVQNTNVKNTIRFVDALNFSFMYF